MTARRLTVVLPVLVLVGACAEERAPINRVQPNVIEKSDLQGEWYYQQTVVDLDTSANYSVIGDNAFWNMERIRWDIQENYLYARRSFEWVENSDNTEFRDSSHNRSVGDTRFEDGSPYMGSIVAAFRIESHFDIRREYNPTTGEEVNVVVENTTDNPWHERRYMRVDWSENLATDFDFDYFYYANGELRVDPVAYYVQDNGPEQNRPVFEYENDVLEYFDITTQVSVHPDTTYEDYYGREIPTCWFFTHQAVDCATTLMTVRSSFLRTNDAEEDFEALEYKGPITETFGFWTTDRMRYNHREGFREYERRRYAMIYNIWEQSHTDQECQADSECGLGSRCDNNVGAQAGLCSVPWDETHFDTECTPENEATTCTLPLSRCDVPEGAATGNCTIPEVSQYGSLSCDTDDQCPEDTHCMTAGRCTIPLVDRTPKPIVYYTSGGWPEDLRPMFDNIEQDYDFALRRAVLGAQGERDFEKTCEEGCLPDTECITEGHYQGQCTLPARQMFFICNSPVREGDPPECGPEGLHVRLGDIRFNQLHYSREWNPLSPLGQTPIAPDPFNGRIFGATITLYDAVDAVAHRYLERAQLLNGDLDPSEFINGANLEWWVDDMTANHTNYHQHGVTDDQVRQMYQSRSTDWMDMLRRPESHGRPDGYSHEVLPQALAQLRQTGAFNPDRDPGRAFLHSLHRTPVEALMMNDEVLMASNFSPGTELTDDVLSIASITSPEYRVWREAQEQWFHDHNWGRNIFYADLADVSLEDLARLIRGMEEEDAYQLLRQRVWHSVITHELGHSFGLFHNFTGSEDTVNFPEEWWAARTDNFTRNPQNRMDDPLTEQEIEAGYYNLGYTSVMDYNANYASQEYLGSYDKAALLFGYGRTLEVYNRIDGLTGDDIEEYWSSGGSFLRLTNTPYSLHYTEMYRMMGRDLFARDNRRLVPVDGLEYTWLDVVDRGACERDADCNQFEVGDEVLVCSEGQCHELRSTDDMVSWVNPEPTPGATCDSSEDCAGRSVCFADHTCHDMAYRVPYLYCNDYRADLGENCHRWDFGYDVQERMQYYLNQDAWTYLTRNFRRGAVAGDADGFVGAAYERYYERFKQMHDYYNLIDSLLHMYFDEEARDTFMVDRQRGWGTYTVAMHDGFNLLARTLTRPDASDALMPITRGDGTQIYGETGWISDDSVGVALIDGRYFTTTWWDPDGNDDCGAAFWECLHHYGFYLNKLMALMILGEAETFFVARDTAEDIRMWRISFFDDYADQIMALIGGIMSEDYASIAPYIVPPEAGADDRTGELVLRDYATPSLDPAQPEGSRPVDPYTGFTVQLYVAVLGYAMMHTNFDNRFITSARMWIRGGDHGVDPEDPTAEYEDPETGLVYSSLAPDNGMGIAQRMIAHANHLRSRTNYCNRSDPEAPDYCAADVTREERDEAEREMLLYRDQLDIMVHLTARYDNWLFSYGDPFNPGDVPSDW